MTRENVRNARETEHGVLDALEIDNSSSGEVIFTIAEKFSSFVEQKDKIGDLEKVKFVRNSALQSLAACFSGACSYS